MSNGCAQHDLFGARPTEQTGVSPVPLTRQRELGQYMTPAWAASLLVERFFPGLGANDRIVEPSCGDGAFLQALPAAVEAIGVEIDPALAEHARRLTGRQVITGDFRNVTLPFRPDCIIGNPPFAASTISGFLGRARAVLPADGVVGFILPAYALQTASSVARYSTDWGISATLIPRNLFRNLQCPLVFAIFERARPGALIGLGLYLELHAVNQLPERSQQLLGQMGTGSVWQRVVARAIADLGGEASLEQIYQALEDRRPTKNPFWREQIRKVLRQATDWFDRTGRGRYALVA